MSHFVVAWESGSTVASLCDAYLIGQAVAERGHRVSYLVGEPIMLAQIAGPAVNLDILQAPITPGRPHLVMKPPRIGGFADHMALQGYGEPETLRTLASAWKRALDSLEPDAIIAVGAPVVWLVGRTVAPIIVAGEGWTLPPVVGQAFPRLLSDIAPIAAVENLVENANGALASLGAEPVASLAEILEQCVQVLYGASYYDPHLAQRRHRSHGLLGASPNPTPLPSQPHLVVFLDVYCPNIESIIVALAGLDTLTADVYVRGATRAMRDFLAAQPGLMVCDDIGTALACIAHASAVVHHGLTTVSTHALAQGRPQLVFPWLSSHYAHVEGLKALGVTWEKSPNTTIQEIAGTLRALPNDASVAVRSQHYAQEMHDLRTPDALPALVEIAEQTANPPRVRAKFPATSTPSMMATAISATVTTPPPVVAPQIAVPANDQDPLVVSDGFCSMPFQHLCVGVEGTARMCCVTNDMISDQGAPMSLYRHSLDEIWNSDYMREMRRKMLVGEPVSQCQVCYDNEAATGISYRTTTGLTPVAGQTINRKALERDCPKTDHRMDAAPEFLKLELGNLCNLKCRMCYGGNSSEIERDPVHSRWAGGADPLHAIWRNDEALIGPDNRIGVKRTGIHEGETFDGRWLHWTNGKANLDIPISPSNKLAALEIHFDQDFDIKRRCRVRINGRIYFDGHVAQQSPRILIDLSNDDRPRTLRIEIQSDSEVAEDGRRLGVPLTAILLRRVASPSRDSRSAIEVLDPALKMPGLWYRNDDVVFSQLLGDLSRLKRLYVTGGEPLIEQRFGEILDHLIAVGAASHIHLELTTNLTTVDDDILDRIAKFGSHEITLSIDGVGAVQEYIRYPSRWAVIEKNARKMAARNLRICGIPVPQAYNMLGLADICWFGREIGLEISLANVVRDPQWLRPSVMPVAAHRLAADRLRAFAESEKSEWWRTHYLSLVHYFESFDQPLDHAAMRQFMLFTNDLDISRGQSFRHSLPELHGLIVEAGFEWTDETLHARAGGTRGTARDRVHAWI